MPLDPRLKDYATPKQLEALEAIEKYGSQRKAAEALGKAKTTIDDRVKAVKRTAARHGVTDNPNFNTGQPVPEGYVLRQQTAFTGPEGEFRGRWDQTRQEGGERDNFDYVPDPRKIKSTATYTNGEGRVLGQWTREVADAQDREELWKAWIDGLKDEIKPIAKIPASRKPKQEDLCFVLPIGDHHLGMLAWAAETGEDYDIEISDNLLRQAVDYLVDASPACETALIASLGDFNHYDSFESVTPTARNQLDADGRFPKMIRASSRLLRYSIESALRKHQNVHVIVEIGNHDLASSIWMMELLQQVYEKNDRVKIDTGPGHFHYFQFGKCLVGTHHGHGTKLEKLANIMAADVPEMWGQSTYRHWFTGHIHHEKIKDHDGVRVETCAVLAPADAYARNKGYRSRRQIQSILLHKDIGEIGRQTFTPGMMG